MSPHITSQWRIATLALGGISLWATSGHWSDWGSPWGSARPLRVEGELGIVFSSFYGIAQCRICLVNARGGSCMPRLISVLTIGVNESHQEPVMGPYFKIGSQWRNAVKPIVIRSWSEQDLLHKKPGGRLPFIGGGEARRQAQGVGIGAASKAHQRSGIAT